jgi:Ala-tRNA(Pro) deacylase
MAMAVLPAPFRVDFDLLKTVVGSSQVELATEEEFKDMFPGCEVGAMPPFGNLYGMAVYVAESLAEDEEIAFNAGTHTELIKMSYQDFANLVEPVIARISSRHD